jgi:Protein of unknown function (DUF1501)
MLSIHGNRTTLCDGITRREALRVGGLAFGGLTLADVLRFRAEAAESGKPDCRPNSVIMIWLRGAMSHIDSLDMKPDAPAEIRGEFKPVATNVPGIHVCEHMPRFATMMEKLAVIRGIKSNDLGDHTPHYILTGFPSRGIRPVFGGVVSYLSSVGRPSKAVRPVFSGTRTALEGRPTELPPYVSLMYKPPGLYDNEGPTYLGPAHRPFVPKKEGLANLRLAKEISLRRLHDRKQLLRGLDTLSREVDATHQMDGIDSFTKRALEIIVSPKAREAFDLKRESQQTRDRYGKYCKNFLMARRLVEAGVSVVTLKVGDWDTHEKNFIEMRDQLPKLDQGFHSLVSDLHDRGLDKNVAVVLWGEFGRAPKITRGDGRDHWPDASAAVIAGGGFKTGQTIGETDKHAARSKVRPYTPANVLSNLYRHLGIDPAITLPDRDGRPMHVLDDREPVRELS